MKKIKIKKTNTERLWSRNSNYSNSVFYHIEGLRLFTSQQISSTEDQQFQNKCNTATVADRLPTVPRSWSLLGTVKERLYLQKTVHNTYACKGTLVPFPWFFSAWERCERAAKRWPRVAKWRERTWISFSCRRQGHLTLGLGLVDIFTDTQINMIGPRGGGAPELSVTALALFCVFRWFRFGRFVSLVSVVLSRSFRSFRFVVSDVSTCSQIQRWVH